MNTFLKDPQLLNNNDSLGNSSLKQGKKYKKSTNIVKSKNLIDIRTPFFLNAKLELNKKSNLVKLNSRVDKIDSIENIYVQEFNKDYMKLKIKYLGNLEKIINQLNKENIELQLINDQWVIKTL